MKKAIIIALFALISGFKPAAAQVHISVNIGSQPVWGPSGYDYADYYYLPDIDMFYYIPERQWVYMQHGRWIFSYALPARYRNYDLYNCYKVVVNEPRPYLNYNSYRSRYASYRGRHGQPVIRDCNDPRYYVINEHPRHSQWRGDYRRDGRGDRNDNGYRRGDDHRGRDRDRDDHHGHNGRRR